MPANYSMNPTNPNNQAQQPQDMQYGQNQQQAPAQPMRSASEPRTIRDYIALARQRGETPTFTNRDSGQGFDIRNDPQYIPNREQAIPEEPIDEYEKVPFAKRVRMDPYIRATRSMNRMLPELFETMFPGMNAADLSEEQQKQWVKGVEGLNSNLLKRYDSQYEWAMKNEDKTRAELAKEGQFWQKFYADAELKGNIPRKEDGTPMSPKEFIDKQLSISQERQFVGDMQKQEEAQQKKMGAFEDLSPSDITGVIRNNAELAQSIKQSVIESLSQTAGAKVGDEQLYQMRKDPQWKRTFNEATKTAIDQHKDQIMQLWMSSNKR